MKIAWGIWMPLFMSSCLLGWVACRMQQTCKTAKAPACTCKSEQWALWIADVVAICAGSHCCTNRLARCVNLRPALVEVWIDFMPRTWPPWFSKLKIAAFFPESSSCITNSTKPGVQLPSNKWKLLEGFICSSWCLLWWVGELQQFISICKCLREVWLDFMPRTWPRWFSTLKISAFFPEWSSCITNSTKPGVQ